MKDIMKGYKKHKVVSNMWVVIISLALALGINFFVIDWTELWKHLKVSVLNTQTKNKADIFLEKDWEKIVIKNSKKIKLLENISFSINYDPLGIKLKNMNSDLAWSNITELSNTPGFSTIIIDLDIPINLKESETLFSFLPIKTQEKVENINIINANFSDSSSESYDLTTSWITF